MLHILWLIIKFILIALGIVLGLLLLAILLILFCPVRYQAVGAKEKEGWKEVEAAAKISWLFRLVSLSLTYQNGSASMGIRLFGIPLEAFQRFFGKIASFKNRKNRKQKKRPAAEEKALPQNEEAPPEKKPSIEEKPPESSQTAEEKLQEKEPVKEPQIFTENAEPHREAEEPQKDKERPGLFQRIWDKIKGILHIPVSLLKKTAGLPGKVMEKLRKIRFTLQRIYGKIDWWKEFLFHPRTKAAISLVWQNAKGLIRHVMPVKIEGSVTFGSEDPAVTGAVLAVMGMTIPFHKNRIELNPLFDGENQLIGNVRLKGRIYGFVFLKAAIVIYFNKNIKYVISRWKHKED